MTSSNVVQIIMNTGAALSKLDASRVHDRLGAYFWFLLLAVVLLDTVVSMSIYLWL